MTNEQIDDLLIKLYKETCVMSYLVEDNKTYLQLCSAGPEVLDRLYFWLKLGEAVSFDTIPIPHHYFTSIARNYMTLSEFPEEWKGVFVKQMQFLIKEMEAFYWNKISNLQIV